MSKLRRSVRSPGGTARKKGPSRSPSDETEDKIGSFIRGAFQGSKKGKTHLTYRAFEIIPRNSPYGHHFRSLLNAENFVNSNEHQMALDIYQRLLNKIPLRSTREKIEQNIDDIETYLNTHEDLPTPKIALDVNLGSAFPPSSETEAPKEGGARGSAENPIQIQLGMAPPPEGATGQLPSPFAGYPFLPPPGVFPGGPGEKPKEDNIPKPFGFFQQKDTAIAEGKEIPKEKEPQDLKSFFDSAKALSDPEMLKKTNSILEDISDGIFNIEKAIFDANRMDVESEETEVEEKPALSGEEAGAETGAEKGEEERKAEEKKAEPKGEAKETGLPSAGAEEAEAPVQGEEKKEEAPEEEIEKSEGVLEQSGAIPSFDEMEEREVEPGEEEEAPQVQEIRGVLELKEPEQEDTPFITITYDFSKIPHGFYLSKDHNILEYAYYKYKPMLVKAQKFIRKKQITRALNYYRVIRDQQIPDALREMIDKNIRDISEYLEKYLMTRPG